MKLPKIATAACAFAAFACAPAAFAATETIVLGTSNVSSFASQDMAHLTITEDGNNTVWTLAADWDNALNSRNPFIYGLSFTDTKTAKPINFSAVTGTIEQKGLSATSVNFLTANKTGRFTDGETATWTFKNTRLTDFGAFQLHVNSVTAGGESVKFTQWVAAPVPEPETYAMLLAGLGLVGFVARRRAAR